VGLLNFESSSFLIRHFKNKKKNGESFRKWKGTAIRAAFRVLEPPLTYGPWGSEIRKAHITGPSPIQNGPNIVLWDPKRERERERERKSCCSFFFLPSVLSFLSPSLALLLPSFLPFLPCYFFSFLQSSSARQSSQMEWNTKSVLMLVCVCVCVCVCVGPINLLPNLRQSFDFWES